MRCRPRTALQLVALVATGSMIFTAIVPRIAHAGDEGAYMGVFGDPQGTQTCVTLPQSSFTTLYLVAFPAGDVADGITGAEFRLVVTNPDGYLFTYVPPADTPVVLGNPLDLDPATDDVTSGANVAFSECQDGAFVSFGTLQVFNVNGGPTEIRVERRQPSANFAFICPLFTGCGPEFEISCMRACEFNASGSAIASRCGLNQPDCSPQTTCPSDCAGAPCLEIGNTTVSSPRCVGSPVTVTTTVANCGTAPADVDVVIEEVLAGSFTNVAPGANVVASRTYTLQACGQGSSRIAVGALATNAACAQPIGFERQFVDTCSEDCGNQPPDCSKATLSVTNLWPADGRLVEVELGGVTDPEGGPVTIRNFVIGSDEPSGNEGSPACPDAFIDSSTQLRLRAERSNSGDGRVYRVFFIANDASGNQCAGQVDVCVPRKPGGACSEPGHLYAATTCTDPLDDDGHDFPPVVAIATANGVEVTFGQAAEDESRADIYDVRGRRLAQLAHGRFAPGQHVLRWDGRDQSGRAVANGVYIVRVVTGGTAHTAKVALVR